VCTAACGADEFACGAGARQDCIPARWRCDSDNDCGNNADEAPDLCGQFIHITSGQRTLTIGHIAPALVTPVAGESIPKPRFRRDALSTADKSAAPCCCGVCCIHSLLHFNWESSPKNCHFPCGKAVTRGGVLGV